MHYFVTGATGFIGRRLVRKLLTHSDSVVYFLVRTASLGKVPELQVYWDVASQRAIPVCGALDQPLLGISEADLQLLTDNVDHFFHLAAIYDLNVDEQSQIRVNVEGTRHTVALANTVRARHFHHVSSIAAAGLYKGVFREDMFEEAEQLQHPYFLTKHNGEKIVRHEAAIPFRIYRPGMVVGDSVTGVADKIDGPYYFFKFIQRLRQILPQWMPMLGLEGGRINIVPVDFVVNAMDHIAHLPDRDGQCFHLTDSNPMRVGDVLNTFARAAHGPSFTVRVNAALFNFVPSYIKQGLLALTPIRKIRNAVLSDLGIPETMLQFINYPTRFDNRNALDALQGSQIECPELDQYAANLWDYWERHLDPALLIDHSLKGQVAGKNVLITGGSSGIGLALAHRLAEAGAHTIICARGADRLEAARSEIAARGFAVTTYQVDLSDLAQCRQLVATLLARHGKIDFLVNNAGHSIRRSIEASFERFHDYERLMQLNYFGALCLIMGLLPAMTQQKSGQIINISSIGVLTNAPRFSAYVASKAALDAWTRCAASEFSDLGIKFTTINMPLVKTPMIAPTRLYANVPTLSAREAAELVVEAIVYKPVCIATRLGRTGQVVHALMPRIAQIIMNTSFRMFPDSDVGHGQQGGAESAKDVNMNADQYAMQQILRGLHF